MPQQHRIADDLTNDEIQRLWLAVNRLRNEYDPGTRILTRNNHTVVGEPSPDDYSYEEPPGGTDAMAEQVHGTDGPTHPSGHHYLDFWIHTSGWDWSSFGWNDWMPYNVSKPDAEPGDPGSQQWSLGDKGYKITHATGLARPHSDAWCWVFGRLEHTTWGTETYSPYMSMKFCQKDDPQTELPASVNDSTHPEFQLGPINVTSLAESDALYVLPYSTMPGFDQMYRVELQWAIERDGDYGGNSGFALGDIQCHWGVAPHDPVEESMVFWAKNVNPYMGGGTSPPISDALVWVCLEWTDTVWRDPYGTY